MKRMKVRGWIYFVLVIGVIGINMYILNVHTPLVNDDISYSFVLDNATERVTNVKEIISGLKSHYLYQGGRMFSHFFTQLMLIFGDTFFNYINTLVYILLLVLMINMADIKLNSVKGAVGMCVAHLLCFLYMPAFAETVLWLDGSTNYLWTTVIALLAIYPFIGILKDHYPHNIIYKGFIILICGLGGMTNENVGIVVFIMQIIIEGIYYNLNSKKIPFWAGMGTITTLIGYAFLFVAPGNWNRLNREGINIGIINSIVKRVASIGYHVIGNSGTLFILLLLLILLSDCSWEKVRDRMVEWLLVFGGTVSMILMLTVPKIPARSFTFSIVLFIILTIKMLDEVFEVILVKKRNFVITIVLFVISLGIFSVTFFDGYMDIIQNEQINNTIIKTIEEQKEYTSDIVLRSYPEPRTKYAIKIALSENKEDYFNVFYARYYNVKSIIIGAE